jgi:hypothetical protein
MTPEELIRAAQDALGADRTDDYKIQPSKHADELAAKAPSLAAILRRSDLSVLAGQYERKDQQANENQAVFKATATRANWAVLLTACFSTLLLIVGPMKSVAGLPDSVVLAILGACGVISGGLGSMWVYQAREGKLLDNWMSVRATAEALRAAYFEAITSVEVQDNNAPMPAALLEFEYFRRYQLDVQIAFYQTRAADHRRDADRMLRISAGAVALASISAGLAGVLGGLNTAWVSIAALGTVATALASFAATKESVNQSNRNAERYTNTCDALTLLKRKLDVVRIAAAAGQREPMKQFVAAAHEQISAEHRQWLATAQSIQPAIDKLDDTLSKLKPKQAEPPLSASAQGS